MKIDLYKKEFTKQALNVGYSEDTIKRCLDYATNLYSNKVPVIYNITHLSSLVGYNKEYMSRAVKFTKSYYRDFEIKKRNGKMRGISEPLPSLKEIQQWILKNILYKVEVSPFAKAYIPGVTLKENLRFHKKQPMVYTLDLVNFFASIKRIDIEKIFRKIGYSSSVSNLLSKLCCKDGYLPQGASTSPCLSNIFFVSADELISDYCFHRKIRYTRYADDLTFSGSFDEKELLNIVSDVVKAIGLKINNDKTKLMKSNMRQTVTGVVVNDKPQVVFHKRNELRQEVYYIKKLGIDAHIKNRNINQRNYLEHLLGKINFILQINPADQEFSEYKKYLKEIKKGKSGFKSVKKIPETVEG